MAWEQVAFIAITHVHADTDMARRIHERVATSRAQQDNEMYHLLIIEELIARSGQRQPQIKFFLVTAGDRIRLLSVVLVAFRGKPAEHEYMTMVAEHPDWDSAPFESSFADEFGQFASLADVFRQIGHDERVHKLESEALMKKPRFR
jgi:ubiquinol oxidase